MSAGDVRCLAQNAIEACGGQPENPSTLLGDAIDQACAELKLLEHILLNLNFDADFDLHAVVAGIRKRLALASDSGEYLVTLASVGAQ